MKDYNIWITCNGTKLKVSEMTDTHIKNCIKMIERSVYRDNFYDEDINIKGCVMVDYEEYEPYLEIFEEELNKRRQLK